MTIIASAERRQQFQVGEAVWIAVNPRDMAAIKM